MSDLHTEIRRAAGIVARKWPGIIETDDAEQEIWLRLIEHDQIDTVTALDEEVRPGALIRIGCQVALSYRADHEVFSGQVFYGTDEVRAMLAGGLLGRRRDELDASTDTLSEWMDLHEGAQLLRDLNARYADVIGARYLLSELVEDRKLLTRAVDALTVQMNQVHTRRIAVYSEGPGARSALSNATARYITG